MDASRADELQPWIDRVQAGDEAARSELLAAASDRLLRLTRKMLNDFPGVGRWEDTDDVMQNAAIRLHAGMKSATFESVADFLRFAAVLIRRELIDLSRHYHGPQGLGRNYDSTPDGSASRAGERLHPQDETHEPAALAEWTEFHSAVEELDDADREVFDLLWYQELTQGQAAAVLGINERTVQRRWQSARLKLHEQLKQRAER